MIATAFRLVDAAVPGSAVVGDDHALAASLAAVGEELVSAPYLRHKPGTSLVRGLWLGSGPAFAYAVSRPSRPKLDKLLTRAPHDSVLVAQPGSGLVIARPRADRDLPALARLRPHDHAVLAYKPQRRWVARASATETLRVYRPSELAEAAAGWSLRQHVPPEIAVPALVSVSVRRGMLTAGWLPGESLDRLAGADRSEPDLWYRLGAGLAGLHGAAVRPAPSTSDDKLQPLIAVRDQVGRVLPELKPRLRTVVARLVASAPTSTRSCPVHGDFSADQVVVDGTGRLAFTDWDRAGWGDPAGDLGGLAAAGLGGQPLESAAWEQTVAGYVSVRDLPDSLPWSLARAQLLRLADPLRECRPDWPDRVAARLADLERTLAEADR